MLTKEARKDKRSVSKEGKVRSKKMLTRKVGIQVAEKQRDDKEKKERR